MNTFFGALILVCGLIIMLPIVANLVPLIVLFLIGWILVRCLARKRKAPTIPNQDVGSPPRDVAKGEQPPSSGPSRTR